MSANLPLTRIGCMASLQSTGPFLDWSIADHVSFVEDIVAELGYKVAKPASAWDEKDIAFATSATWNPFEREQWVAVLAVRSTKVAGSHRLCHCHDNCHDHSLHSPTFKFCTVV